MTMHVLARAAAGGCTKDTCPASASIYGYAPDYNSTLAFIVGFGIFTLVYYHQSFVWPKWRFYSLVMAFGCAMESAGYVGRLMLSNDAFDDLGFKINVILLTIAPAFLSAGLYVMLKRLVILFGPQFSRISPSAYAYIFVTADVVSIVLQGVGGAMSAMAKDKSVLDQGVDIMIAGLVSQVFTLSVFAGLCIDFGCRVSKQRDQLPWERRKLARSLKFKLVVVAMAFAFLCIYTRCAYRVAELCEGWGSEIMRKEVDFIVLDSVMCLLAAIVLSIFHPGYTLPEPNVVPDAQSAENQTQEKTRGYSMMPAPVPIMLDVPGKSTCPRCNCWDDRRSWI